MNDLICKVGQTMTHLQIAEVVGSRPDSVKRTIETLAEKGIITFTQEVGKSTGGRPATIYHVNERNSYVVVAQLSPEFTAKLVDFWQETKEEYETGDESCGPKESGAAMRASMDLTRALAKFRRS